MLLPDLVRKGLKKLTIRYGNTEEKGFVGSKAYTIWGLLDLHIGPYLLETRYGTSKGLVKMRITEA